MQKDIFSTYQENQFIVLPYILVASQSVDCRPIWAMSLETVDLRPLWTMTLDPVDLGFEAEFGTIGLLAYLGQEFGIAKRAG